MAESAVPLADHTPRQIMDGIATRIGHYNSAQKLRLTLSIKPPHLAEEEQFLRDLTDRNSPNFHHFLTPEEWNTRFAPSAEDEQAAVDWAISQGFTVTHRFNHRLLVDVEAPVAVIEKAFGVTVNQYQYHDEADFSNDRDPLIPARLQGIVFNVQGLNNIQRDHSSRPGVEARGADYVEGPAYAVGEEGRADARAPRPTPAAVTADDSPNSTLFTNGNANPTEIYSSEVYNYNGLQNLGHCCNPHNDSGGAPNVSNIAIAAFGLFYSRDVIGFQAAFPYLAYNYQTHYIDGTLGCSGGGTYCPSGETTQDVEWTIATANSFGSSNDTAKIFPYIGANGSNSTFTDMYGFMLSDNLARVFTTSWSCTEVYGCSTSTMDSRHNIFNSMIGQGWTIIAASGDRGTADDCNFESPAHKTAAYPGSDYDVLAAGGTQLSLYSDGTWAAEKGWQGGFSSGSCKGNGGGSGGGISSYYGKPGYQGYSTWNNTTRRSEPDISLNALGIGQNLYINGALKCCANGTSIVAPELAGFFAQENAYLNYIGHVCGASGAAACTPVGNPMPYFYRAAYYGQGYVSHFPFYDMTAGCNDNDVTVADGLGYYCSHTGWDYVTGWGSANMLQLSWAINWYLIPATGNAPTVTWTGPAKNKWYNSDQQLNWKIKDPQPSGSTYPSSGIAGFTQGWDSIAPDSFSKAHGGKGDTFWSGPEYPNFTNGCMTLVGNATCPGGVSQGCHTAHVRGWNNQGWTTGEQTYGPICYDTVIPTISISNSPVQPASGWWTTSVKVTLTPSDSGGSKASGIKKTYYAINTTACYPANLGACSVYSGPITFSAQQHSYIYYFTEDNAGNFSNETYEWVSIDLTAPTTTASLSGTVSSGTTYSSAVKVTLNASDTGGSGVKSTYYEIDGGSAFSYTGSAITVSDVGSHTVKFWSFDVAGNEEAAKIVPFSIVSPTTATVVATPNPSVVGQSVKMKATVTATLSGTPTGSVTFWNGATNLGTGTLSGGVATLSTTTLPAGALTLQVSYAGAGNFMATNSPPFDQTVETQPQLLSPAPGSTLAGPSVTFTWAAAPGASGYGFRLGTTVGASDLYASGTIASTSVTPAHLPTNGETIYARLYTHYGASQLYTDYVFTATTQAAITSPAPSSVLTGANVTFSWSTATGATGYGFRLGTTVGGKDLFATGEITSPSATPNNLPTNGETIYARLTTFYGSTQVYTDYVFTAYTTP